MIVYNITIKIDPAIKAEWLQWQHGEHIPEIMATGLFSEYRMFRLLEQDEEEGITYVVQYFAGSMDAYQRYVEHHAPVLRRKALEKWGERFVAFRTVMELVN
jgi:hypothetical protein